MNQGHAIAIFCKIADFCKDFEPIWRQSLLEDKSIKRQRTSKLHLSEIMAIAILSPFSGYQDFKTFYQQMILYRLQGIFQNLATIGLLDYFQDQMIRNKKELNNICIEKVYEA